MKFNFGLILLTTYCMISHQISATVFNGCSEVNLGSTLNIFCNSATATTFPTRTNASETVSTNILIFTIQSQRFTAIPANSFFGLSISELIFSTNGLTALGSTDFTGATSIASATFSETSLTTINAATFTPIASSLRTLSFTRSQITTTRMELLKDGLQSLNQITKLTLDTNSLVTLSSGWFTGLTGLQELSVKSNSLAGIDSTAFSSNTALKKIDLSTNQLTDMTSLMTALTPLASVLETLTLDSNRFTTVVDMSAMSALKTLSLKSNMIATLASTNTFTNLPGLTSIDLSQNSLTAVPAITKQLGLVSLDISNNSITTLADNALSRESTPTTGASILMDLNTIATFGTKSFCSASSPFYSQIDLTYASFKNFNKCLFKQMKPANAGLRVTMRIVPQTGVTNYTDVCNCDNQVFANTNQVDLTGACTVLTCTNTYSDTCAADYTCTRTTSGGVKVNVGFLGFIVANAIFLLAFTQF